MDLLELIKEGKENAVTLFQLVWRTGEKERAIRAEIAGLREQGHLICNDQDGKGYYIATTVDEVRRQYQQDTNRFLSICRRMKAERQFLRDHGVLDEEKDSPVVEQMSLFETSLTTT